MSIKMKPILNKESIINDNINLILKKLEDCKTLKKKKKLILREKLIVEK